tara:strand:+ start:581 stop:715 length:135 start_codon:yes stop_codon:yes gene_type:complete
MEDSNARRRVNIRAEMDRFVMYEMAELECNFTNLLGFKVKCPEY